MPDNTAARMSHLQELSRGECLQLLGYSSYVGHVGFVADDLPMILPVNYLYDKGEIIIRTSEGTALSALDGVTVAFEVDDHRALERAGWSVLVHGSARRITNPDTVEALRRGPLHSWARDAADEWLAISVDSISGRRIPES